MAPKAKYNEGEKVLCFHGPLIYEAKIQKVEIRDKVQKYFMHYSGWNKNWDEWVTEARILKHNEAGLQKQKELLKAHSVGKGKKGRPEKTKKLGKAEKDKPGKESKKERPSTPIVESEKPSKRDRSLAGTPTPAAAASDQKHETSTPSSEPPKKKRRGEAVETPVEPERASTPSSDPSLRKKSRRGDVTIEKEESFLTKVEVRVKIPDDLKPWLVDDWDLIMRQKKLVNVPTTNCVNKILEDYVKYKNGKGNNPNQDAVIEVTSGIKEYFNVMLGTQLLYKFERPQYAELIEENPNKQMSELYGSAHLLRLFVKLGQMLAYTRLEEKSVTLLLTHIHDFLKYMQKNSNTLFNLSDYIVASPDYHRKAL